MRVININLQQGFGGGEVYTRFFIGALAKCAIESVLLANPAGKLWESLAQAVRRIPATTPTELPAVLAGQAPAWLVFHSQPGADIVRALKAQGHYVTCFAHMPLHGRDPLPLMDYDAIFPVSGHVGCSAVKAGLTQLYPEPLYGIADFAVRPDAHAPFVAHSPYDWDRRKVRDRLMGALEPLFEPLRTRAAYVKADGIVLGIVSRLTTIKQFPRLFSLLAPILARHPAFRVEIFGAGGYASVRDLRQALWPIAHRTRFWGHQTAIPEVYAGIDYLLTGLPEKEALGLNVLEAQACACPVLAVDARPFTETVAPEISGLFYRDPREDAGADFERLLKRLEARRFCIDAGKIDAHLAQFSEAAFTRRVARLAEWVRGQGFAGEARCA